jgi:hypothetical protein
MTINALLRQQILLCVRFGSAQDRTCPRAASSSETADLHVVVDQTRLDRLRCCLRTCPVSRSPSSSLSWLSPHDGAAGGARWCAALTAVCSSPSARFPRGSQGQHGTIKGNSASIRRRGALPEGELRTMFVPTTGTVRASTSSSFRMLPSRFDEAERQVISRAQRFRASSVCITWSMTMNWRAGCAPVIVSPRSICKKRMRKYKITDKPASTCQGLDLVA